MKEFSCFTSFIEIGRGNWSSYERSTDDYFDCPGFGVIRAVDEFCLKYGYEITFLVEADQSGDWILSPKR